MCTALSFSCGDHYFGRTLDLAYHYRETVTVTPRKMPLTIGGEPLPVPHFAMIGMATVQDGFPLYYDAVNECGLCMAALRFPDDAVYLPEHPLSRGIASFELILWLLAQCETVEDALARLRTVRITPRSFSEDLPATPLHWLLADRRRAVAVEPLSDGLSLFENPFGVLTNSPAFPVQQKRYDEPPCAIEGTDGFLSSSARFARAARVKAHSARPKTEEKRVGQFFHLLGTVSHPRGFTRSAEGLTETVYTSCINADRGVYYYTTYRNRQITAVDLNRENLSGERLVSFPLVDKEQIRKQN